MKTVKRKLMLPVMIFCLLAGSSFGCAGFHEYTGRKDDALTVLTIGTADSGGTMSPAGKAIAQVVSGSDDRIVMNVSAGSGSAANVQALVNGDVDLGLVSGDVALNAVNGNGEFSEPAELRAVAAVYTSLSNWLTLSSSDLVWVHDLAGKRIGIGPEDSTSAASAVFALGVMGIDGENSSLCYCGLGSGAGDVKSGTIDAVQGFAGIPINGFAQMAGEVPCRILKYAPKELNEIIRGNPFYYRDTIPAGTYEGQDEDVPTFGLKCLLCVRADMDEELVYKLTGILCAHPDELAAQHAALGSMGRQDFMCSDLPIELHPGAERCYRELGLLKDAE